jgi:adenylyltransferase/sulfurtransferase
VDRYSRQVLLAELGGEGQEKLRAATVTVIGCGALGCAISELLVRAGVGRVRLVDRDIVELDNLHRQLLFDERDVTARLPKAVAAGDKLAHINSEVSVETRVLDVAPHNILPLLDGADLAMDGTDNIETRYLLNDACLERQLPWIYGGAVGTLGMTMSLIPGGPCLRCLFPEPPPPASLPTCDTRGILNTLPVLVASYQVTLALKLLTGRPVSPELMVVDPWEGSHRRLPVARADDCPACVGGRHDFLDGFELTEITRLCGRNAVQVYPVQELGISLECLAAKLEPLGPTENRGHYVSFSSGEQELLVFPDGRTVVQGTTDVVLAKRLFAQYVGS